MNLNDLNVFAAAARFGSITKAAHSLSTVQSNVTARIRSLEDELGVQLFHRNPRGIRLTAKGLELLPYAQQTMALVQQATAAVSNNKEVQGILRIGSLQSTASTRLPDVLKAYVEKHRKVDIAIESGTAAELIEKVVDYRLDGAFVAGPVPAELEAMVAFVEELVMVTPVAYRSLNAYLRQGPITKVLVFKAGCFYREKLERYLASTGTDVLQEMEFGTLDGIIGCVSAGLGITMLPRSVVERSARRKDVRVHALAPEDRVVETLFIAHRTPTQSPALARFKEVIAAGRPRPATAKR
ncbi:MAG: LysR family transcriptional regulator [Chthoniobacter sp.]